jgi:uncharacterized protein
LLRSLYAQLLAALPPQLRTGSPNMDTLDRSGSCHPGGRNLDSRMAAPLYQRFGEVITTESELRNIVGPANRWFTSKILDRLDRRCQDFVAASPFVVVGSVDPSGFVDLSPKGDRAGFVKCLDDLTLAIPDRRGNGRVDTFHNVLQHPGVGLIFVVPGRRETLRVTGRAIIVRDQHIRGAMADRGRTPDLATIVGVEKAFFHCGRCITRSGLWDDGGYRAQAAES